MYSLDVNFLNDRPEYKPDTAARARGVRAAPTDSRQPLILGLVALIALLAIPAALLWFLQSRNGALEQRQAALDTQLGDLQQKQKQIDSVKAETKQVKDETAALASVFNTIKPWSAVMQDFRDRIPPGVQILRVKQVLPVPGQAPPTPNAQNDKAGLPENGTIEISGIANSFNDVNDFLLVLQKSDFLDPKGTKLVSSELPKESPAFSNLSLQTPSGGSAPPLDTSKLPKLPKLVGFTIQTSFNDIPASELLQELEKKTAVGLVTRIEELQRKGVIRK
ncbi:PilN domain-containing protein [Kovacikia minuta CCNUW1]|uniref:PilN domain-containing protein n=1 Tax=Kovacikia minuta TaxID=2931930 RepID=UPI001CCA1789|nr:PilN domain-containing protein [Kovacikia minuta]UBF27644.1 PilN domain-containing protein [Kovacikia minuta CCNUW1]